LERDIGLIITIRQEMKEMKFSLTSLYGSYCRSVMSLQRHHRCKKKEQSNAKNDTYRISNVTYQGLNHFNFAIEVTEMRS